MRWTLALVGVMWLTGCMRGCGSSHASMSPEEVVQAYLDTALNLSSVQERGKLLEYTTGPLRDALASASDEVIQEAYVEPNYELKSYTVVERKDRTPRESEITFMITFKNLAREGQEAELKQEEIPTVTVENTVSVIREKGLWMISDILNKKSSFAFPLGTEIQAAPPTKN